MAEGMLGEVEGDIIESVYDLLQYDPYHPVQAKDKSDENHTPVRK